MSGQGGRRTPRAPSAVRRSVLTVPAVLDRIPEVRALLRDILGRSKASEEEILKIELAVHEICVNIVRYAYPTGKETGYIRAAVEAGQGYISVELRDAGLPFDPAGRPLPDVLERIRRGVRGGLGVYLYKVLSDSWSYRREEGENVLTVRKTIGGERPSRRQ